MFISSIGQKFRCGVNRPQSHIIEFVLQIFDATVVYITKNEAFESGTTIHVCAEKLFIQYFLISTKKLKLLIFNQFKY